ncbi:coiled-coil domain-containing protein 97 [Coccinella septempunctata]|uniref:coiled-coil domain-containing protein 97 n=1 Tax=Coccinella septempunctata TaxID=41139 RepID=UPI001D084DA2|nr:coiled-coil domain-containing protein 97 [Coccinella septempunctata]XP_044748954.1 coiled-coil domain-containing protein 97 [Coccinella septempunctata]
MTMDSEPNPEVVEPPTDFHQNTELEKNLVVILNHLTGIEQISFKSQQKGEADLTREEKFKIGVDLFSKNKLQFLLRFGDHLHPEHLEYFNKFTTGNDEDADDMRVVLNGLSERAISNKKLYNIKNRRFEALQQMIVEDKYFSEIEMMKRNPLLYDQLIGQYLTQEEIKERDKYRTEDQTSFVKILMEGIERSDAEKQRIDQEEYEDNAMEESDSDSDLDEMKDDERSRSPPPSRSLWGEFHNEGKAPKPKSKNIYITAPEKKLLREEFITTMYESFLDGADKDFDYESVDSNSKYDCIETLEQDEEEKYFDSEEPATIPIQLSDAESEDELDIFMSALNDNPTVRQLSTDIGKISTSH